jgi:hypothetical protein
VGSSDPIPDIDPFTASAARVHDYTLTKQEIAALVDGLEPVDPGLVFSARWRPVEEVPNPERGGLYGVVARKLGRA